MRFDIGDPNSITLYLFYFWILVTDWDRLWSAKMHLRATKTNLVRHKQLKQVWDRKCLMTSGSNHSIVVYLNLNGFNLVQALYVYNCFEYYVFSKEDNPVGLKAHK